MRRAYNSKSLCALFTMRTLNVQAKLPTFQDLNSIVTEVEAGRVIPSYDGDITFSLCAEMCDEESEQLDAWTNDEKKQRHPMIISALRKLYPRKPDSWYETKPYLKSPRGSALYWKKVLAQKAKAWRAKHEQERRKANKAKASARGPSMTPVQQRIKEKLAERNSPTKNKPAREGRRATPIVIGSESSNSDDSGSNDEAQVSIPPTQPDSPAAPEPKLAPGPETYTRGEMKTFARMAATINNVDVAKGHSAAVADFVDSEFSDNSGMMSKARRAPKDSWVKRRFNSACEKAAKIMEERWVACEFCSRTTHIRTAPHYPPGSAYSIWGIRSPTLSANGDSKVSLGGCPNCGILFSGLMSGRLVSWTIRSD